MKSLIDMARPMTFYAFGVGLLMVVSLMLANIPQTNLSVYYMVFFKREIAGGLFAGGTVFGVISMIRHVARTKTPWKIPQSQVTVSFALFFLLTLAALVIAK